MVIHKLDGTFEKSTFHTFYDEELNVTFKLPMRIKHLGGPSQKAHRYTISGAPFNLRLDKNKTDNFIDHPMFEESKLMKFDSEFYKNAAEVDVTQFDSLLAKKLLHLSTGEPAPEHIQISYDGSYRLAPDVYFSFDISLANDAVAHDAIEQILSMINTAEVHD